MSWIGIQGRWDLQMGTQSTEFHLSWSRVFLKVYLPYLIIVIDSILIFQNVDIFELPMYLPPRQSRLKQF